MSKEGSTISGLMDTIATMASLALQYGVPLETLVNKFGHMRFEPSGMTPNPEIRFAKSIPDYIFRWLGIKFAPESTVTAEDNSLSGSSDIATAQTLTPITAAQTNAFTLKEKEVFQNSADAPACAECGSLMVRNGACYKCMNCGSVFGCS